jgi:hypothetical protein
MPARFHRQAVVGEDVVRNGVHQEEKLSLADNFFVWLPFHHRCLVCLLSLLVHLALSSPRSPDGCDLMR